MEKLNRPITNVGLRKSVNNTPQTSVISMVANEEEIGRQNKANQFNNYFKNRSDIRTAIDSGQFTSGNKAQDTFESRIGKLIDPYLEMVSKKTDSNGKPKYTQEQIIEASKNVNGVLEKMKKHYGDKAWAIDDYIQNGGYATNVFEYLEDISGTITNPYGQKVEVRGNLFDENTPERAKGVATLGNKLPSLGTNIAGRIMKNDRLQNIAYKSENQILNSANDDEYNLYRTGKLPKGNDVNRVDMYGNSKAKFYDDYTQAKKDGFNGNIDNYKTFRQNVYKTVTDAMGDRLKEGVLTEDDIETSKTAIAADTLSEIITYLSIPGAKDLGLEIEGKGLGVELANILIDSLYNTAEYGAIEGLSNRYNGKDASEIIGNLGTAEFVNFLIGSIVRSPYITHYIKNGGIGLTKIEDQVEDAFSRLTGKQIKNLQSLASDAAGKSTYQAQVQGYRQLGKEGVAGVKNSFNAYLKAGDALGEEAKNLRNSGITVDLIENSMNKALKKLESEADLGGVKWGEGQAPQIKITQTSAGPEISISHRENLNMITNGENKGLADAMEDIFYGMFRKGNSDAAGAGMELNEASMLAFMNEVKGATEGTEWSWGNAGAKYFGEGLAKFREDAKLPESFLTKEKAYGEAKDLYKKLSEGLGVDLKTLGTDVALRDAEYNVGRKMNDESLASLLNDAQSLGYISDTIDAEVIAYAYFLALENELKAKALLDGLYPSMPGLKEKVLEYARNTSKQGKINRYIKREGVGTLAPEPQNPIWNTISRGLGETTNVISSRVRDNEEDI